MEADLDILEEFRKISRNRSEIKLLNSYKGLPISYGASIDSVNDDGIEVHSNRYQIACLYHQGESYFLSNELPYLIRSQVISLNLGKENAVFSNFERVSSSIGNRSQIRVQPDEPIIVSIRFDGLSAELLVPLADISGEGASLYFENYLFPARQAQPGNTFSIMVPLPDSVSSKIKRLSTRPIKPSGRTGGLPEGDDGQIILNAHGRVVGVQREPEMGRYRVSTRLYFKDLSRLVVMQYISMRQTEIIQDLRNLSDELYKLKK